MKHPPERPLIVAQDTREPHIDAGDHPDAIFRPCVFPPGIPKDTPWADRPRASCAIMREKLDVGDYSLPGLTHAVALERKSGADLLATLFGGEGTNALGEARHNQDRFRAELERAKDYALFAIICEASEGWLFTEARRRFERYGKSFDPFQTLALLRSFAVDLGVPTLWCGTKGLAELEVGSTLARVWSQATGGEASRKAKARGLSMPWLDVLRDVQSPFGRARALDRGPAEAHPAADLPLGGPIDVGNAVNDALSTLGARFPGQPPGPQPARPCGCGAPACNDPSPLINGSRHASTMGGGPGSGAGWTPPPRVTHG